MKPNHHWAIHFSEQLRDFGPVHGFWTFLAERLNKTLKNYNSNNHCGGELEASMMRAFDREVQIKAIVSLALFVCIG